MKIAAPQYRCIFDSPWHKSFVFCADFAKYNLFYHIGMPSVFSPFIPIAVSNRIHTNFAALVIEVERYEEER